MLTNLNSDIIAFLTRTLITSQDDPPSHMPGHALNDRYHTMHRTMHGMVCIMSCMHVLPAFLPQMHVLPAFLPHMHVLPAFLSHATEAATKLEKQES